MRARGLRAFVVPQALVLDNLLEVAPRWWAPECRGKVERPFSWLRQEGVFAPPAGEKAQGKR
jgi:hypothetical protein